VKVGSSKRLCFLSLAGQQFEIWRFDQQRLLGEQMLPLALVGERIGMDAAAAAFQHDPALKVHRPGSLFQFHGIGFRFQRIVPGADHQRRNRGEPALFPLHVLVEVREPVRTGRLRWCRGGWSLCLIGRRWWQGTGCVCRHGWLFLDARQCWRGRGALGAFVDSWRSGAHWKGRPGGCVLGWLLLPFWSRGRYRRGAADG